MAVEVVHAQVEQHRHPRPEAHDALELEARKLGHRHLGPVHHVEQGRVQVAPGHGLEAQRFQEVLGGDGGGALPGGAGNADERGGGEPVGQLGLADDLGPLGAQALERRVVDGHAGRGDHLAVAGELAGGGEAPGLGLRHLLGLGTVVVEVGGEALAPQVGQHPQAAAPQAKDQAFAHAGPPHRAWASAVVMAVTTTKRKTTLLSSHPESSKWWCSGLILKMRRPVRRK